MVTPIRQSGVPPMIARRPVQKTDKPDDGYDLPQYDAGYGAYQGGGITAAGGNYAPVSAAPPSTQALPSKSAYDDFPSKNGQDTFTAGELANLSPRQLAVLQAQSQIWDAVQADKNESIKTTPGMRSDRIADTDYANMLKDLFPQGDGSETYAPRTAALLSKLDLGSDIGDIDQFLSGKTFLTKKQILQLGDTPTDPTNPLETFINQLADSAVKASSPQGSDILPLIQQGQSILDTLQGNADYSFAQGRQPAKDASPLDNLTPDQSNNLDMLMRDMALPQTPENLGTNYGILKDYYGITPELVNTYLSREMQNWRNGLKTLGDGYISPEEFAARWGVN